MNVVTAHGTLICKHGGVVSVEASQSWVRIDGYPVFVAPDPENRRISHCPLTIPVRPCVVTQIVLKGYSNWLRIDEHAILLDNLEGVALGTPPQNVYVVRDPGQVYVSSSE